MRFIILLLHHLHSSLCVWELLRQWRFNESTFAVNHGFFVWRKFKETFQESFIRPTFYRSEIKIQPLCNHRSWTNKTRNFILSSIWRSLPEKQARKLVKEEARWLEKRRLLSLAAPARRDEIKNCWVRRNGRKKKMEKNASWEFLCLANDIVASIGQFLHSVRVFLVETGKLSCFYFT